MIADEITPVTSQSTDYEVLIVEDTLESLVLLTDLMQSSGYSVRQAQDGEMALVTARNRQPDLILLDVRMPKMDGFEVCAQLKTNPVTADIPVIFLTAMHDSVDKLQGLKLGAVDYISKPYEPEEVLLRVRTHLELRRLQLHLAEMVGFRTKQLTKEVIERRKSEVELRESRQQLRALTSHLEDVREEERTRIARELHDELGQSLTVILIDLNRMISRLDRSDDELRNSLENTISMLEQVSDTTRTISENLRPGIMDLLGLEAAIENHVKRFSDSTRITCNLVIDDISGLDGDNKRSMAVFRIMQEALTNVARHSRASNVDIRVVNLGNELIIIIQDNGIGIEMSRSTPRGHYGLLGMRERAQSLGGQVLIEGSPGKGTRIEANIPYTVMDEEHD